MIGFRPTCLGCLKADTTCVVPDTLDESPMAYKSIEEIVSQIGPTAIIVERIHPVYNFKASD